jgi:CO/xanthine dehydrogenase FAD-binding subunit
VFCCGLATDFCVAWTAQDARKLGFQAVVIEDACRAIDLEGSLARAIEQMQAAGVRLAVTGAAACAFRLTAFEAALQKAFAVDSLEGLSVSGDGYNQDLHGSADYRASLVPVMARRAVAAALAR